MLPGPLPVPRPDRPSSAAGAAGAARAARAARDAAAVRRLALGALLAGVLAGCRAGDEVVGCGPERGGAAARHVVVLVVDDLGARDLGVDGSTFHETPHIDRLAGEGVRFTRGYAAAPVCSPTRVALMTGRHPARLHNTDYFGGRRKGRLLPAEYDEQLALEEVTLAEAFEAGFGPDVDPATIFLGKWHLGGEGFGPLEQGFDENVGGWRAGHPYDGYFAPWGNPALTDSPDGTYLTDRLTDEAVAFLDRRASEPERPFLLYLAYYNVHTPLQAPAERVAHYAAKRDALGFTDDERWGREGARKLRLVQDHATYGAMVEAVDTSVGRILERLDALGLADETLVVLTSDNGGLSTSEGHPTSNLPLRAGKGWLYEGGIREPWIWRGPGLQRGQRTDAPLTSADLMPTVLQVLGLEPHPEWSLDGRSVAPELLRAGTSFPPDDSERPLYWHYPHYGNQGGSPGGAIRVGRWKLVEHFEDGRLELFDLVEDPGEQHDRAADDPERARELHERLLAWRDEVDARMPRTNPDFEGR